MARVGIIGGTGFHALAQDAEPLAIETPYGDVTVGYERDGPLELFTLRRHGEAHVPPHRIDHRSNVDALARCKVDAIFALNAVGAIDPAIPAGSLLVPDDFLDMRRRHETFHDEQAVHVDFTEAYCPTLRAHLLAAGFAQGARLIGHGVYAATEGPRLESRAEIRALRTLGASVVGMTGLPEATLARERALCYASLCLVTNPAAGVTDGGVSADEIRAGAVALGPLALGIARDAAREVRATKTCACGRALDGARL